MLFRGITKSFSLADEEQYETIGAFWDEMAELHGLANLIGLGYLWKSGKIHYAIGLKTGDIQGYNFEIFLPDSDWVTVKGETDNLKEIYDEIYKDGALRYEIEVFYENGCCEIKYYR